MANWVDGRWNGVLTRVGFGAIVMMQAGCEWIVANDLSDTNAGGKVLKSVSYGNNEHQRVTGVVVDKQGTIVVAGTTVGTAAFGAVCGAGPMVVVDSENTFLSWLDATTLEPQCPGSKILGSAQDDAPRAIAIHEQTGAVGIAGRARGSIEFPLCNSVSNTGLTDTFAASFAAGNCNWLNSLGGVDEQEGFAIDFDANGNAYVGGFYKGSMTANPLLPSADGYDGFIIKLDGNNDMGAPMFHRVAGGAGGQFVFHVAIDASDNIITSGFFDSTFNMQFCDSKQTLATTQGGIFVASLLGETGCNWQRKIADVAAGNVEHFAMAAPKADIYITGSFRSSVLFPGHPCELKESSGQFDGFVAKLRGGDGECLWSRRLGDLDPNSPREQTARALVVDAESNVYVTGTFTGGISLPTAHTLSGEEGLQSAFVVKLDAQGEHRWSKAFQGGTKAEANAIGLHPQGQFVVIAGTFLGKLNLGPSVLPKDPSASARDDIFIAKLTP